MRYIVPEMEIRAFANENIVTNASGNGDSVQAVKDAVNAAGTTANADYNGSGAVVAEWSKMSAMGN